MKSVIKFAAFSRVAFFSLYLLSDLCISDLKSNSLEKFKWRNYGKFSGLVRFDSHYFLSIAEFGYEEDFQLAFFPLYPILIKASSLLLPVENSMGLFVSAHAINFIAFLMATHFLYELTLLIFKGKTN